MGIQVEDIKEKIMNRVTHKPALSLRDPSFTPAKEKGAVLRTLSCLGTPVIFSNSFSVKSGKSL